MRHKLPAAEQIGIERDPSVVDMWKKGFAAIDCQVLQGDAVQYLNQFKLDMDTVVYVDPPYHPDTRRQARVYRYDYSVSDHEALLDCLTALPCKVLISGYSSPLYETRLAGWNKHTFQMRTRVGMREECVWFNYPVPSILHDDRYLGKGFRQREVIRRRQDRLRQRIQKLSVAEQASLHVWLGALIANERAS